jgi:hypothetical protein
VPEVPETTTGYLSFADAIGVIGYEFDWDSETNPDLVQGFTKSDETITIHFINGMNLDPAGNARVWAFGTSTANGTQLRAYDGRQWTIIPFEEPFVSAEIDTAKIIPPDRLFAMNRNLIFPDNWSKTGVREIELRDGVYSLTFQNTSRTLTFDAATGELLDAKA